MKEGFNRQLFQTGFSVAGVGAEASAFVGVDKARAGVVGVSEELQDQYDENPKSFLAEYIEAVAFVIGLRAAHWPTYGMTRNRILKNKMDALQQSRIEITSMKPFGLRCEIDGIAYQADKHTNWQFEKQARGLTGPESEVCKRALAQYDLGKKDVLDLRATALFGDITDKAKLSYRKEYDYDVFEVSYLNNQGSMQYSLRINKGDAFLVNDILDVGPDQRGGAGLRILDAQITAAKQLKNKGIPLNAIYGECAVGIQPGGRETNGAYTWGVMGFDFDRNNELGQKTRGESLPGVVSEKRTALENERSISSLHQLLEKEGGRAYRRDNAFSFQGKFDLTEGSMSLQRFAQYKEKKEQERQDVSNVREIDAIKELIRDVNFNFFEEITDSIPADDKARLTFLVERVLESDIAVNNQGELDLSSFQAAFRTQFKTSNLGLDRNESDSLAGHVFRWVQSSGVGERIIAEYQAQADHRAQKETLLTSARKEKVEIQVLIDEFPRIVEHADFFADLADKGFEFTYEASGANGYIIQCRHPRTGESHAIKLYRSQLGLSFFEPENHQFIERLYTDAVERAELDPSLLGFPHLHGPQATRERLVMDYIGGYTLGMYAVLAKNESIVKVLLREKNISNVADLPSVYAEHELSQLLVQRGVTERSIRATYAETDYASQISTVCDFLGITEGSKKSYIEQYASFSKLLEENGIRRFDTKGANIKLMKNNQGKWLLIPIDFGNIQIGGGRTIYDVERTYDQQPYTIEQRSQKITNSQKDPTDKAADLVEQFGSAIFLDLRESKDYVTGDRDNPAISHNGKQYLAKIIDRMHTSEGSLFSLSNTQILKRYRIGLEAGLTREAIKFLLDNGYCAGHESSVSFRQFTEENPRIKADKDVFRDVEDFCQGEMDNLYNLFGLDTEDTAVSFVVKKGANYYNSKIQHGDKLIPFTVELTIENEFEAVVSFKKASNGYYVFIEGFERDLASARSYGPMIRQFIARAKELGCREIALQATRHEGRQLYGHNVWLKYGFETIKNPSEFLPWIEKVRYNPSYAQSKQHQKALDDFYAHIVSDNPTPMQYIYRDPVLRSIRRDLGFTNEQVLYLD